jgi:hypothetical protein
MAWRSKVIVITNGCTCRDAKARPENSGCIHFGMLKARLERLPARGLRSHPLVGLRARRPLDRSDVSPAVRKERTAGSDGSLSSCTHGRDDQLRNCKSIPHLETPNPERHAPARTCSGLKCDHKKRLAQGIRVHLSGSIFSAVSPAPISSGPPLQLFWKWTKHRM